MTDDTLPSDVSCDEPSAVIRAKHCTLRERIARFRQSPDTVDASNVLEFEPALRARNQSTHDLHMALARLDIRSADAGRPDDDGSAA